MEKEQWHPGKLMETSGYYWKSCTLHAGVKLDIFTAIGGEWRTAASIARSLKTDVQATSRLLNALAAMNLLVKNKERFENTDESRAFLSKESPKYIGHMILHHYHLMPSWAQLDKAVRTGAPVRSRTSFDDPAQREAFLMGMFNNAMLMAPGLVKEIDLPGRKHLLDLGGGPGTYAIHFCMANPQLNATVYDLPTTRPFAEKTIERFGLTERIDFMEGDYIESDIAGRYDVLWMSHILHGEGPDDCRRMIQKAVSVLEPGGMIIVHDFILQDTMDRPLFPAIFSLNMLLGTPSGQSYSEGQIKKMLMATGVKEIRRHSFKGPMESGIMMGIV